MGRAVTRGEVWLPSQATELGCRRGEAGLQPLRGAARTQGLALPLPPRQRRGHLRRSACPGTLPLILNPASALPPITHFVTHKTLWCLSVSCYIISVLIMYPKKETRNENLAARRRCNAGQRVHGVPEDQQRLLGLLVEATDSVIRGLPGFASAKPH